MRHREVKNLIVAGMLLVSVAAVGAVGSLPVPWQVSWGEEWHRLRRWCRADFCTRQCGANMRNLGRELEMYATDNLGLFPTSLGQLVPNYVKSIPTCPAAGSDTYSSSFHPSDHATDYTLGCKGWHFRPVEEHNLFPTWKPPDELDYVHMIGVVSF